MGALLSRAEGALRGSRKPSNNVDEHRILFGGERS